MASIKLDDLDEGLVTRLRERAETKGRSVEAEAASILGDVLASGPKTGASFKTGAEFLRRMEELFGHENGVDLELPPRGSDSYTPVRPRGGLADGPSAGASHRTGKHLVDVFREAFAPFGGVELDLPTRNWTLDPPKLQD